MSLWFWKDRDLDDPVRSVRIRFIDGTTLTGSAQWESLRRALFREVGFSVGDIYVQSRNVMLAELLPDEEAKGK